MSRRALATEVAFLDELFRIVPSAARRSHGDGHEKSGDDGAHENAAENDRSEAGNGGHADHKNYRKKGGNDHLAKRGLGDDVHTRSVIRLVLVGEDPGFGGDLPTHLADHRAGGHAHGVHGTGGENKGEETPDKETDDDFRFDQGEFQAGHGGMHGQEVGLELLDIGAEENQRGESGGGDGVALGDGLHGVADRIEFIRPFPDLFGQAGHHRDPAGVVGDRAKGVEGDDDAGHGKHGHDGDGDPEEAGEMVAQQNGDPDETDRQGGGVGADRQTGNDIGGVSGL